MTPDTSSLGNGTTQKKQSHIQVKLDEQARARGDAKPLYFSIVDLLEQLYKLRLISQIAFQQATTTLFYKDMSVYPTPTK